MAPDRPEVLYALLCEDVRVEADNKMALLGVWGGIVRVFASPPAALAMIAAHAHVTLASGPGFRAHLTLRFPGGLAPFTAEVDLPAAAGNAASGQNLNLRFIHPPLLEPGDIEFTVRIDGPEGPVSEVRRRLEVVFEPPGGT